MAASRFLVLLVLAAAVPCAFGATVFYGDSRSWLGANTESFRSLLGITAAELNAREILDDGIFDVSGPNVQAATMIPTAWTATYGGNCGTSFQSGSDQMAVTYSIIGPDPCVIAAGSAIDNYWIQNPSYPCGGGDAYKNELGKAVWKLQGPSARAAIFPSVDHGPFPAEAIESTVYLGNSPTGPWTQAELKKVWLEGRLTGIGYDGFVYAVGLPGSENQTFTYVTILATGPGSLNEPCGADDEIDGVLGITVDNDVVPPCEGGAAHVGQDCTHASASFDGLGGTLSFDQAPGSNCNV